MSGPDIYAEHRAAIAAADHLTDTARARFHALVGRPGQRLDVGGIGLYPISTAPGSDLFELAESGPMALIFPARDWPNAYDVPMVDLVAYLPKTRALYRRLGIADLLGAWHIEPPAERSIPVFASPAEWALSGGNGVVVLDWARAHINLGHIGRLIASDVSIGKRLAAALKPPARRLPEIHVMAGQVAA